MNHMIYIICIIYHICHHYMLYSGHITICYTCHIPYAVYAMHHAVYATCYCGHQGYRRKPYSPCSLKVILQHAEK